MAIIIWSLSGFLLVFLAVMGEYEALLGMAFAVTMINIPIILVLFSNLDKISNHNNYDDFSRTEKEITIIILAFLKLKKYDNKKCFEILKELFDTYSEKLFILISDFEINLIIESYTDKEINIEKACSYISKKASKFRLFILYNLLDIAAYDKVYSNDEEKFINEIRKKILIPIQTLRAIKAVYTKKGLQEERKIIEEQNRKKIAESFLPYNAYKVLGISPTVTKTQLKKVYRTLAKKYHPDKFFGQSEDVIEKAEDKFQEITKAYEIIKKYIKKNNIIKN